MKRSAPGSSLSWLATGIVAGIGIGWLTAPRRGDWLRNQLSQKLIHYRRVASRRAYKRSRDVENRLRGGIAEVREVFSGREHYVDANTLVDQVHSQLGRQFAEAFEHVNLNAVDHTIYLHGFVHSPAEADRLAAAILTVDGVRDIDTTELRVA